MENLAPVKSFLQELIKPIVVDAVNEAIPKVVRTEPKEYLSVEEVEASARRWRLLTCNLKTMSMV